MIHVHSSQPSRSLVQDHSEKRTTDYHRVRGDDYDDCRHHDGEVRVNRGHLDYAWRGHGSGDETYHDHAHGGHHDLRRDRTHVYVYDYDHV